MKFKKSQSGRSMVEMLGVLAIIGVLSVGGIAGYSLSMRRHRANQMVDYTSKFAATLYAQCQKLILDGVLDGERCNMYGVPSQYSDTDIPQPEIGPLPAGVKYIGLDSINNTSDHLDIDIHFSDQKLCHSVSSIVGTGTGSDTGCTKSSTGTGLYHIIVNIKQN